LQVIFDNIDIVLDYYIFLGKTKFLGYTITYIITGIFTGKITGVLGVDFTYNTDKIVYAME